MLLQVSKRVLPFTLTLFVGAMVGGFKGLDADPVANENWCVKVSQVPVAETTSVVIISKPEASYTSAARKHEVTGTVRLRGMFGANGKVTDITPLTELPDGLTEAAIDAARRIKFEPETQDGIPVPVERLIEYEFYLP